MELLALAAILQLPVLRVEPKRLPHADQDQVAVQDQAVEPRWLHHAVQVVEHPRPLRAVPVAVQLLAVAMQAHAVQAHVVHLANQSLLASMA